MSALDTLLKSLRGETAVRPPGFGEQESTPLSKSDSSDYSSFIQDVVRKLERSKNFKDKEMGRKNINRLKDMMYSLSHGINMFGLTSRNLFEAKLTRACEGMSTAEKAALMKRTYEALLGVMRGLDEASALWSSDDDLMPLFLGVLDRMSDVQVAALTEDLTSLFCSFRNQLVSYIFTVSTRLPRYEKFPEVYLCYSDTLRRYLESVLPSVRKKNFVPWTVELAEMIVEDCMSVLSNTEVIYDIYRKDNPIMLSKKLHEESESWPLIPALLRPLATLSVQYHWGTTELKIEFPKCIRQLLISIARRGEDLALKYNDLLRMDRLCEVIMEMCCGNEIGADLVGCLYFPIKVLLNLPRDSLLVTSERHYVLYRILETQHQCILKNLDKVEEKLRVWKPPARITDKYCAFARLLHDAYMKERQLEKAKLREVLNDPAHCPRVSFTVATNALFMCLRLLVRLGLQEGEIGEQLRRSLVSQGALEEMVTTLQQDFTFYSEHLVDYKEDSHEAIIHAIALFHRQLRLKYDYFTANADFLVLERKLSKTVTMATLQHRHILTVHDHPLLYGEFNSENTNAAARVLLGEMCLRDKYIRGLVKDEITPDVFAWILQPVRSPSKFGHDSACCTLFLMSRLIDNDLNVLGRFVSLLGDRLSPFERCEKIYNRMISFNADQRFQVDLGKAKKWGGNPMHMDTDERWLMYLMDFRSTLIFMNWDETKPEPVLDSRQCRVENVEIGSNDCRLVPWMIIRFEFVSTLYSTTKEGLPGKLRWNIPVADFEFPSTLERNDQSAFYARYAESFWSMIGNYLHAQRVAAGFEDPGVDLFRIEKLDIRGLVYLKLRWLFVLFLRHVPTDYRYPFVFDAVLSALVTLSAFEVGRLFCTEIMDSHLLKLVRGSKKQRPSDQDEDYWRRVIYVARIAKNTLKSHRSTSAAVYRDLGKAIKAIGNKPEFGLELVREELTRLFPNCT